MEHRGPAVAGTRVLNMRDVVLERFGREPLNRALSTLPAEVREEYLALSPISWVQTTTDYAVHDAIAKELGKDPIAFHEGLLREAMQRSFKTLWRIFLRFTSDEALLARAPIIYAKTRNTGTLVGRMVSRTHGELTLSTYPKIAPRDGRSIAIGLHTVLVLTGRNNASVTESMRPDGAVFAVRLR
jgi:hypothetical protein